MPIISPIQITPGTTIDAADVNNPINMIANLVNGKLDSDNLANNSVGSNQVADTSILPRHLAALSVKAAAIDFSTIVPDLEHPTVLGAAIGTSPTSYTMTQHGFVASDQLIEISSGSSTNNIMLVLAMSVNGVDIDISGGYTPAPSNYASLRYQFRPYRVVPGDVVSFRKGSGGSITTAGSAIFYPMKTS